MTLVSANFWDWVTGDAVVVPNVAGGSRDVVCPQGWLTVLAKEGGNCCIKKPKVLAGRSNFN